MRILNIIIVSLLLHIGVKAQEVKVLSFKSAPMDLSASTHPRYDINNDVGALVKVLFAEPNVKFEGDIIGTPEFKANEYWVYVTAGTKFLKIKAPNAIPIQVSFSDYSLSSAQSKMTYELVLSRSGQTLTSQQKQKFTIMFTPSNANVLIDNNMYPSENGKVTGMLSVGKHEFIVASLGYESSEGTFTLKESSPYCVELHLSKSTATALESSALQGNGNNVNNNSVIVSQPSDLICSNSQYILDKVAEGNRLYNNKNYKDAYNCFLIAAEIGNAKAQYYLGKCYYSGNGVTQNSTEAVKWYRKAAEQGYARAQYWLGFCYTDFGQGVTKDYTEAVKWYRKAAEQGNSNAQYDLGYCYAHGQGVVKDYIEAVKWYRKAAGQGNVEAQYYLGVCYQYGQGVEQNYTEAVKWYLKAAEQGLALAQKNLGRYYELGQGVARDDIEALKWYKKAAEQGIEDSKKKVETYPNW